MFGLLCVWCLIKQNIWTWPLGIAYILISIYVFYTARLYADLVLHLFYLGMNIYGWYYWIYGKQEEETELPVTATPRKQMLFLLALSAVGVVISGTLFARLTDAALPYWDNTVTVLSLTAMWLQSRKKIESWMLWLAIDLLATGIYLYKELYFYSTLYLVYIAMAVAGYLAWRKSMGEELAVASSESSV